jgi:hypothetical protein
VVPEVGIVRPDFVDRHVEASGQGSSPCGGVGGLAPVVGDPDCLAVLELANGHVPVQTPVAVVARPLDHDHVVEA